MTVTKGSQQKSKLQWQEAELDNALTKVTATMHGIVSENSESNAQLGPTPTAKVKLEGSETEALLDTGSPVTIVSLQFLLEALAKRKRKEQSPDDWRAMVEKRFEPSTITLQNYSGVKINIIRQMRVSICRSGSAEVQAIVQVQKDAPAKLLIGTDLLPALGFIFLQTEFEGEDVDLLKPRQTQAELNEEPPEHQEQSTGPDAGGKQAESIDTVGGVVRLIQATRVPARHKKLLRARVTGLEDASLALFEPDNHLLGMKGLSMAEAATEPDTDNCVTLIMQNDALEPTHLKKGQVLGRVYPASLSPNAEQGSSNEEEQRLFAPSLNQLSSAPQDPERQGQCEMGTTRRDQMFAAIDLDQSTLTEEQCQQLQALLCEYADIFALDSSELGSTDLVTHTIDTANHPPIDHQARRTPFALHDQIDEMVRKMLVQGVIEPSQSPWASPVVLVKKKDGSYRFCVDYRRLNSVTKMDVFPLPRIDDTLDLLSRTKFFTTLDLASGYWQVRMHPKSKEKTAFATWSGLYQFVVMPFGLCNAPATFQRLMETVLTGLACDSCMVYIDDILVIGATFQDHLENIRKVFARLRAAGLCLKPQKCSFVKREVTYLGYVVSSDGMSPDSAKVDAVKRFPQPLDLRTLRSFLGLASYYRRFIPQFSVVASPLHALTRKNAVYVWDPVCQRAFERLKELLTVAPVLAFPDFSREFMLETDASGAGLGAVLAQKQEDGLVRPIAYAS